MSVVNKARLLSYIERVERLEEEKKAIADDIKDVKAEAKSAGFDVKMITKMIALRRLTPAERRLEKELTEIYEAACGLLDGTPLGDAARERLMKEEPNAEPAPEPPAHAEEVMRTVEEAREEGGEAFRAGVRIIDNPYTAGDPRRAAWDEGFCAASGSDGMDIPAAWRRKAKKPAKGDRRDDDGGVSAEAPASASDVDPDQEGLPFDDPQERGAEDKSDEGGDDWPLPPPGEPASDAPWKDPYAPSAAQPEGDAAERLDDLVKRTRRKQAETAATKEAAKRGPKSATKRGAKAPAKPRKSNAEGQP
ncbi:DUF2312 domain-containing protein [Xanthobacter sp. YC-JY1]|uniref:DUF2312 domain-containing protein n=1 Tax=Xanthobacter sp. YC-JY1 TaxID=2419844 RepID=UPI00352E2ECD|nr:DUF2312 domain-containing protein [Xanthobacter sp. YC-JY1]